MSAVRKLDDLFVVKLGKEEEYQEVALNYEKNLVIIEDDEILKDYLSEMGQKYFNKVLTFESVEKASLYLNNVDIQVDIVLIDYFLPGKKGTEIVSLMKKINTDAKIYLMSGDLEKIDTEDSNLEELEEYIQKPLTFQQINTIYNK